MLLRLRVRPADVLRFFTTRGQISKLGNRLYAVDRDGKAVGLLATTAIPRWTGAFDLGDIRSMLPNDLKHILMELDGSNGRSLFKVDIETGRGEQLEKPENVRGWWLDVNGNAIVRVSASRGTVRMSRKDKENELARVPHDARTGHGRARGIHAIGAVRRSRQVLRARASTRSRSHRALSIRSGEGRIRRAGNRASHYTTWTTRESPRTASAHCSIATRRTYRSASSPIPGKCAHDVACASTSIRRQTSPFTI